MHQAPAQAQFVAGLRCLTCGAEFPPTGFETTCASCLAGPLSEGAGILDVHYDYAAAGQAMRSACNGTASDLHVFRYWPLLPAGGARGSVPRTGGTRYFEAPSLARRLGLDSVWVKDETANPSGCLKDRATAIAVEMARARGARDLCCASAGNAALSSAYYCARAGLACHVFLPREIDGDRLETLRGLGAEVHVSSGDYDQAYAEAEQACAREGWYSRSCARNPFLVEGKKTVSFEMAEQRGWNVPDVVAAPVGDGCTLGAIGKGFRELVLLGFTRSIPRLIGVQAEAVQPVVRRFQGDPQDPRREVTRASSIAVGRPRNAARVLDEVRRSGGAMIAVPDDETAAAQDLLLRETGIHAEFSSATALAGLLRLSGAGALAARSAALVVTGKGRPPS